MRNPFPRTSRHLADAAHEVDGAICHPLTWALLTLAAICLLALHG